MSKTWSGIGGGSCFLRSWASEWAPHPWSNATTRPSSLAYSLAHTPNNVANGPSSRTRKPQPTQVPGADVTFTSGDVAPVHGAMAAAAGDRDLWVVGAGDLAGQFADAGLLDEVIVYIAPVTLGAGAPILPRHVELRLEELGRNGEFACARYAVVR